MSEVTDKMREDIQRLESEINEREVYFYTELEPELMKLWNMVKAQNAPLNFHVTYKHGRLKIIFARFRRKITRRRRAIRKIEIRYKYRTVLLYEYNEFSKKGELQIFHHCGWLPHINEFYVIIPQMIREENYKKGLKLLKKRQKKLETKCGNFKPLCDE